MVETQIDKGFIYNRATRSILKTLRKNSMYGSLNISKICSKVEVNYTTTCNTVEGLEERGLVKSKKQGRTKLVKITDRGDQVAEKLTEIAELTRTA